jgi:hypothetical protein
MSGSRSLEGGWNGFGVGNSESDTPDNKRARRASVATSSQNSILSREYLSQHELQPIKESKFNITTKEFIEYTPLVIGTNYPEHFN